MVTGVPYLNIAPHLASEALLIEKDKTAINQGAWMKDGFVKATTLDVSLPQDNPSASET